MKPFAKIGLGVAAVTLLTACHGHHDYNHYFDKIDANGDGRISHAEMENFGHDKLHRMDLNGDRYVSRDEFVEYKKHKHHRRHHHRTHGDHDHNSHFHYNKSRNLWEHN